MEDTWHQATVAMYGNAMVALNVVFRKLVALKTK